LGFSAKYKRRKPVPRRDKEKEKCNDKNKTSLREKITES